LPGSETPSRLSNKTLNLDGQIFRAWGPSEEPETISYTTWLADAYAEVDITPDIMKESFLHNNPEAPDDFAVTKIRDFPEKRGRLVLVEAGPDFAAYLQTKNLVLDYFMGDLEFRLAVEPAVNPRLKKKTPDNTKPPLPTHSRHEPGRDRGRPDDRRKPDGGHRADDPDGWLVAQSRKRKRGSSDKNKPKTADNDESRAKSATKTAKTQQKVKPNRPRHKSPKKRYRQRSRSRSRARSGSSSSSDSYDTASSSSSSDNNNRGHDTDSGDEH
jgi:hypothetical protein